MIEETTEKMMVKPATQLNENSQKNHENGRERPVVSTQVRFMFILVLL